MRECPAPRDRLIVSVDAPTPVGGRLLSELLVRNPGTGECDFVYHCVSYAIRDGMSGEVFRSNLAMELCGTGVDAAVAVSRIEPTGAGQTATGEGFMACVDDSCRELS